MFKIATRNLTLEAPHMVGIKELFDFYVANLKDDDSAAAPFAAKSDEEIALAARYEAANGKRFKMSREHKEAGMSRTEALRAVLGVPAPDDAAGGALPEDDGGEVF